MLAGLGLRDKNVLAATHLLQPPAVPLLPPHSHPHKHRNIDISQVQTKYAHLMRVVVMLEGFWS